MRPRRTRTRAIRLPIGPFVDPTEMHVDCWLEYSDRVRKGNLYKWHLLPTWRIFLIRGTPYGCQFRCVKITRSKATAQMYVLLHGAGLKVEWFGPFFPYC